VLFGIDGNTEIKMERENHHLFCFEIRCFS
jgi:hypothetical protein